MKIKYQASRLFNFLTVIILSGLCLLLNSLTQIRFHRLELPKNKPEFSSTGITANMYNPKGNLLYKFEAESGIQFPDSNKIIIAKVNLEAFAESNGFLQEKLTSDDGWIDNASSLGYLGKNVVLTVNNLEPDKKIYVYTENVILDADKKTAVSSAPIRGTQGKSVITGNGFKVDYNTKILTLESNVKVIYVK